MNFVDHARALTTLVVFVFAGSSVVGCASEAGAPAGDEDGSTTDVSGEAVTRGDAHRTVHLADGKYVLTANSPRNGYTEPNFQPYANGDVVCNSGDCAGVSLQLCIRGKRDGHWGAFACDSHGQHEVKYRIWRGVYPNSSAAGVYQSRATLHVNGKYVGRVYSKPRLVER